VWEVRRSQSKQSKHKLPRSCTGVFLLTWLANKLRVRKINIQEQFIMAYGGLRGAIAFSMVQMLDAGTVRARAMFVTTTLTVIIFTVFIQVTYLV
jgi:NhaP-type Na+/H+ and K+/H+ antiporters